MKVGDLVKFRCPTTKQFGKVYLVVWRQGCWIRLHAREYHARGAHAMRDFEVVNASR
jgi:hypothetical protein